MALAFGTSKRGKRTVIYWNSEYWMHRENKNGSDLWYCCKHQMKHCKARLVTIGERLITDRQPEHTHEGNVGTAMARKAVGEMKVMMEQIGATPSATPSAPSGAVSAQLSNQTLMALPRLTAMNRALQRHRQKVFDSSLP